VRVADAPDDGPDVDGATVDVPAFLMVVLRAAGEGGHVPMIPPIWSIVKPLQLGAATARAHMISLTDTVEIAADAGSMIAMRDDLFEEWLDR
jgi:hypothetical protein